MIPVQHIVQALLHVVADAANRMAPKTPEQIRRERNLRRKVEAWLFCIVFCIVLAVVVGFIVVCRR